MAQDATGTPTSQGIPKYNTAADAPSGKGFNAAMDAIDNLIVTRGLPASPDTNEPLYWNGSAWVTNKLTDAQMDMTTIVPPGIIVPYAGASAPGGWVIADGAAISRTTFAALFAITGTTFGVGDGVNTFNVPNLKGRGVMGIDAGQTEFDTRGEAGGAKTHTLTIAQLPSHSHGGATGATGVDHDHAIALRNLWDAGGNTAPLSSGGATHVAGGGGSSDPIKMTSSSSWGTLSHGHSIAAEGSGNSHPILDPYMALHYIIKT